MKDAMRWVFVIYRTNLLETYRDMSVVIDVLL